MPRVRFEQDSNWPNHTWTLVLVIRGIPDESGEVEADVVFLVEEAPHHFLRLGTLFDLFEGQEVVGHGEVL
jgi:hypothetical protein